MAQKNAVMQIALFVALRIGTVMRGALVLVEFRQGHAQT
jgi:hypothetical protein